MCTQLMCNQFSSTYNRIEDNRIRLIDFIYDPPEAAPGDTVLLKALFAGKEITEDDIKWNVSYAVTMNSVGIDTAFNEESLEYQKSEPCHFSDNTSCIAIRFVIPSNCILESPAIHDDWFSYLPETLKRIIPQSMSPNAQDEITVLIDSLSQVLSHNDTTTTLNQNEISIPDELAQMLPLFLQLLTVKIRLYAYVKDSHRIRSDYTVSYTPRVSSLSAYTIPLNRNPRIDSIGFYTVKGIKSTAFDKNDENTQYQTLWKPGMDVFTIDYKKGYSYFCEAFVSNRDSVLTLSDISKNDPLSLEEFTTEWFFQLDRDEIGEASYNDLMNIVPINDCMAAFYFPRKKTIKHVTIWVQVTDSKINVMNRSQGSDVIEASGIFSYHEE